MPGSRGAAALADWRRGLLRASIYYHYAKHLFGEDPEQFRDAHERMLRCYLAASPYLDPRMERFEIPFEGAVMAAYLRRPTGVPCPKLAILLPGLDAAKEELHAWSDAFLARGLATVTLDGPGQGETSFHLPIRHDWGRVIGAVIDVLERRHDVDASAVAVVERASARSRVAPRRSSRASRLASPIAALRLRTRAAAAAESVAGAVPRPQSRRRHVAGAGDRGSAQPADCAQQIKCPLLVVFGAGDRMIPLAEGERLARAASGPTDFVVFEEGNHVCFNISYKFRPLTADWTVEHL
jgi:2,6-dihydroxypseudooxynicotine hydrolase